MAYKLDYRYVGAPPLEAVFPAPAATSLYATPVPGGLIVEAEDPVWGPGEFIFARANGTIRMYGLCILTEVWDATNKVYTYNMTEAPTTTLLARSLYVAIGTGAGVASAVNAFTVGQYGWFMTSGRTPANSNATVAAAVTIGHNATGQVTANAAGAQIVNATSVTPATQTVVSASTSYGASGDFRIGVLSTAGFFVGGYVSGTGVGASAIITAVDQVNSVLTVSVANSAQVTGNVTITYNNATIFYNVVSFNRAFAQGAIT
jgi:hypothetical protein